VEVIVDTNVVLDVLLDRHPFAKSAARIFAFVEESKIEGFLCATTVTTVEYLFGQALAPAKARQALRQLLHLFEIASVNRPVLEQALQSRISISRTPFWSSPPGWPARTPLPRAMSGISRNPRSSSSIPRTRSRRWMNNHTAANHFLRRRSGAAGCSRQLTQHDFLSMMLSI
jgi:predicted nucleic acid-binding protein